MIKEKMIRIDRFIHKNSKLFLCGILFIQFLFFMIMLMNNGVIYAVDSASYIEPAKDFIANHTMRDANGTPTVTRTPGYILFLSLVYILTNYNDTAVVLVQIIMSLTITCLIYYLASRLAKNNTMGVVAAFFYISDLAIYQNGISILTDTVFPFCVLLSILFLYLFFQGKKQQYLYLFLAFQNIALAIRPQIMYLNIIVSIVLLILVILKRVHWKYFAFSFVLFSIIFFGWSYRNYVIFGRFTYTLIRDRDYLLYYAPFVYQEIYKVDFATAQKHFTDIVNQTYSNFESMDVLEQVEAMSVIGKGFISQHPFLFIWRNIKGLFMEMVGPNLSTINHFAILDLVKKLVALYCSGMLALSYLIYAFCFLKCIKRQKKMDWIIFLFTAYLMASTAIVGYSRYRMAFYPLSLIGTFTSYKKPNSTSIEENQI